YNVFRYVLDPKATLINEVSQVPPGSYMKLDSQLKSEVRPYWEIPPRAEKTFNQEEFEGLLNESISMRVPEMRGFGTFLSGGLDSGFLTLKSKESPYFKGTFSLDVPGIENERERLEQFLRDHNVKNYSHSLAIDDLLKSSTFKAMDVPTGDSVVFLLNSLFKFSSQKANVFLSGDGADEVFGGYVHHKAFFFGNLFQKIFPGITHGLIFSLLKNLPNSFLETLLPYKGNLNKESLSKLILFLKTFKSPVDAYVHLVGLEGIDFETDLNFLQKEWGEFKENAFSLKELLRFDLKFWGPNYSLNKVDYIAGFNGIEVRVPYYDNKLVEYVISHKVPLINLRQDKILLRQAAARDNFKISNEKKSPFRIEDNFIDSKFNGLGLLDGKREVCSYNLKMWKDSIRL
ncbi:MAG: asparagine synthase-related protein, partial [Halobacteriovoraceae bacterium]|nr:asparagine synthase-related protein [Halobacteriovoraceae bacterium]